MHRQYLICLVLMLQCTHSARSISIFSANGDSHKTDNDEIEDNNIIDFDSDYDKKYIKKYENWRNQNNFDKDTNKYIVVKEGSAKVDFSASTTSEMPVPMEITTETKKEVKDTGIQNVTIEFSTTNPIQMIKTTEADVSVIPLELLSTTDSPTIIDSTIEPDLTVIPLSTTKKSLPEVEVDETVTLPISTESIDETTTELLLDDTTESEKFVAIDKNVFDNASNENFNGSIISGDANKNQTIVDTHENGVKDLSETIFESNDTKIHDIHANATEIKITVDRNDRETSEKQLETQSEESEVPVFTALDIEEPDDDVPEDYYDSKDLIPTKAPSTDALSVFIGFAGSVVESVVESVAERVVPKGIYDLFKRMQKQSEALEAEKLRSREENGGIGRVSALHCSNRVRNRLSTSVLGYVKLCYKLAPLPSKVEKTVVHREEPACVCLSEPVNRWTGLDENIYVLGSFGRGILKSISSGLSRPLSQLMGARDNGSLDSDRGFVSSLASGVSSVATSLVDTFKDRVQAIYPGTVWCGDGRSAAARSSELGLFFFFTDTCCRQHDACKMYIRAGETKHGLTNTGLFTRSVSRLAVSRRLHSSMMCFHGVETNTILLVFRGLSDAP
ncbi:Phospholipase A2 [Eumeta japonica]|uniref:phospholipase A2 n=1 Tax=Eumeta variegata TaxID=151549 RepID=A0A4C1XPZ9_EUMVA|nr:Phospholipase A2 [Eumeta japonica]